LRNGEAHLKLSAGKHGVGLVQCRAKGFDDSRPMGRTERGKRDAKLALRRFDVGRILQDGLNQSAPFVFRPFVSGRIFSTRSLSI
jgi:hypothetical protein